MLNRIIQFSVSNKLIIALFVVALIGYGSYQVTRLPIDAVPDITNNQVQVIAVAPAMGATDIERLITYPIEQANANIPGLMEMRSFSRFGLSVVTLVFNDDVDVYWARQQVGERLVKVQPLMPPGVAMPEMGPVTTGLGEIYQYVVRPKQGYENKYDAMELRTIQDWVVRKQLLGVAGVADISSFGGKLKQYEIAVNSDKLKSYGVTIADIFDALENNNQNTGGAYIEKGPTVQYIRTEGLVGSLADIEGIQVKNTENGTPLFIRDVADVRFGNATRYGALCYNDVGEVAGGVVMMVKGGNSSNVIKDVKERISIIQKDLPEGVVIEPFLDRTKMVNNAIGTVEKNLMEGALIVIFVLVLFLGNFRAGLLVASVIPLAMLFAIIMMNLFGVSGNLMSLGALDFGLIVDGAVIIVEAVMHTLGHSKKFNHINKLSQGDMDKEVNQSAGRMMNSAVFGQIIILIVYLPIFTLQGIEGKMFKPMAQTVAFALLGAFILSLTYIPAFSALFLSKKISHKRTISDKMMNGIEYYYQNVLIRVLNFPKTILAATIALFIGSVVTLTFLGGEFIPSLEEGDFAVECRLLTGSNLTANIEATQKASHILLQKFPEVQKVVTKTGSGEIPTDPMPIDASDMMIILKDKSEWTSAKSFNELADKMSKELEAVPGLTTGFQYPVQMRFNELMTGARQDVVCKIFGDNMDSLALFAQKLGTAAATIDGAKDVFVEPVGGMPQIVITYNRSAIAQYGLNISDVNRVINTAFAGQSAGLVFEGEKRFDMVVRLQGEKRSNIQDVENLLIPTPQGTQIPLYQLAQIVSQDGPNQIQREGSKRRIVVGFNVRGRDVQSIVTELQAKVDKELMLPKGYRIDYGGAFENLNAAKKRLSIAVPISLLLIFLMLYFAFGSIKQGLLIYTAIPLSAVGGIFALAARGMPFSISAGVGFIALFGVAVLNGIVLIAEFNRLRSEGMKDVKRIVIQGTKVRLRPVLMTAFVASLGFLPMAISNGAGAEVQRPLATVVIGGLLLATLLTLFVLPVLYILFEQGFKVKKQVVAGIAVFAFLGLSAIPGYGQQTITLQAALDTALKNNQNLRVQNLQVDYLNKLKGTAWNIQPTAISADYGQLNSVYNDTRFGISQTIKFPTVYTTQKQLLNEEYKGGQMLVAIKRNDLKKQVSTVFYELLFLEQKKRLLQRADSLFAGFLDRSTQRFNKGDSNILEKTTADNLKGKVSLQLNQLQQDYDILQKQFNYLLNTQVGYVATAAQFKITQPVLVDSSALRQNPLAGYLKQQQQVSLYRLKTEKAALLPDISLGYSNMSIRGVGADNNAYTTAYRFQSAQFGLGIPLFFGAQKAKIGALKIDRQIAQSNYLAGITSLQTTYSQATANYAKCKLAVDYYENKALAYADTIINTANTQLQNGDINYLEWVMLVNQAIGTQSDYLDAVKALNLSVIELNTLTNN
jgi:cobalt-zinc-cadmium resistance protein CzcA